VLVGRLLMYQGAPSASVYLRAPFPALRAQDDAYARNAESDLADEFDRLRLYPVVQIGFVYRFSAQLDGMTGWGVCPLAALAYGASSQ